MHTDTDQSNEISLFKLKNKNGLQVEISNFGGVIKSIFTPDKNGKFDDIILGYDTINPYLDNPAFMGCIVGRYANRIDQGTFEIDRKRYQLDLNNGNCSLHGGVNAPFHKALWKVGESNESLLKLTHKSKSMEDGFPGNLDLTVTYSLSDLNELMIKYEAQTDEKTVINLTNHSYFNLNGGKSSILNHYLSIDSESFHPTNKDQIPLTEESVSGTPFDFRQPKLIGAQINDHHDQIKLAEGYDHNWIINPQLNGIKKVATLFEKESGRKMDVKTDQPGIQVYTGNHVNMTGKKGQKYSKHWGICLETQHYPNSPNRPDFPTTLLEPGKHFETTTIFSFGLI